MNWSAAVIAEVPPVVVTLTSTVPPDPNPLGEVTVIWVAELTVKLPASTEPNWTSVAPVKFVPVIVTVVPPAPGPDVGDTEVIVGAGI